MYVSDASCRGGYLVYKGQLLRFLREYAVEIITQPGAQAATLLRNADHSLLLFSSRPENGLEQACVNANTCVSALWQDSFSFYVVVSETFLDAGTPEEDRARSEALNAFAAVGHLRAVYQMLPPNAVLVAGAQEQRISLIVVAFRCSQCTPESLDRWEHFLEERLQRNDWPMRPFLQLFVRSVVTDQEATRNREVQTLTMSLESVSVQLIGTSQTPPSVSPARLAAISAVDETATIQDITGQEIIVSGPRGLSQRMVDRRPALEERLRCTVSILAYCSQCNRRVPYIVDPRGHGSQLRGPCGHWCSTSIPVWRPAP